jgi:ADP-ribose pyrophosphatase YjhB (NUDIX family)
MKKIIFLTFFILSSLSAMEQYEVSVKNTQESDYSYGEIPAPLKEPIPSELYAQIMNYIPIPCVDIFIVDKENDSYFLVKRANKPAKNMWWPLGGRMLKYESPFQTATRKARQEAKIHITPIAIIGNYNLKFSDSEWGTPTHTPVTAVLAFYTPTPDQPDLDKDHNTYQWAPLSEAHGINYVELLRRRSLKKLAKIRHRKT